MKLEKRDLVNLLRPASVVLLAGAGPFLGVLLLATHGADVSEGLRKLSPLLLAPFLFAAGAILSGFALLPSHAVSLAAGWALGVFIGPLVAIFSIMAGAAISFAIGARASGGHLQSYLKANPNWSIMRDALVAGDSIKTIILVALVRLSPLAPFAATNVALASVGVPCKIFLVGSLVGLLPRVTVVAGLGAGMAHLDWSRPDAPVLIFLGLVATVLALVMVSLLAQRALNELRSN